MVTPVPFSSFFKNFLLILCEIHNMYLNPTHLPIPPYLSPNLATPPKGKKNKNVCVSQQ